MPTGTENFVCLAFSHYGALKSYVTSASLHVFWLSGNIGIQETDLSLFNVPNDRNKSYPTKPSTHGSYTWRGGGTSD